MKALKHLGENFEAMVQRIAHEYPDYRDAVHRFKKAFIEQVLLDCEGNQCKAAQALGMHRNTLNRTIADLQIDGANHQVPKMRLRRPA